MATVKPFECIRPADAQTVAALPYDVYSRAEAREVVKNRPHSFLNIDRPETQFPEDYDMYAGEVYKKAADMLLEWEKDGVLLKDSPKAYYVYELIMDGRSQTGIVACASIDDYINNVIKKHENTREDKEQDRIRHVDTCSAQTGPIFLAYRSRKAIDSVVNETKQEVPLYAFKAEDGITHNVWKISDDIKISIIAEEFEKTDSIYIADGHHRAASAVKVGLKRRKENPAYDGSEEFNFFLSVLFPEDQLMIMPYNRVVKDLNGFSEEEFIAKAEENFIVKKLGKTAFAPEKKGSFGMLLNNEWYCLEVKDELKKITDPVASLDVSLLQDYLLGPVLGIEDPRTDSRIAFVGGIRGLGELENAAQQI